jgi:GR25 family glycosyltransferase involved in LPS biosynthesis
MIKLEQIKTYVINLDKRKDRLSNITLPIEWERFVGTDGSNQFKEFGKLQGHIGCWDSHRRLLLHAKNNNYNAVMILEDDVEFSINFKENLKTLLSELPDDWDLLYLGGWNVGETINYSKSLNVAKLVYTTHAYIIRDKFINTALESINSRKWKIDVLMSEALPKGNCFIANPSIAWQKPGFSDIVNKVTDNKHLR